jgi:hypothetical protein
METEARKELTTPAGLVIQFKHEQGTWPQAIYRRGKKIEVEVKRRTVCNILSRIRGVETVLATGEAYCSPTDNFEYELGRQYALNEALRATPRPVRCEVMQTYLGRTGAQPWRLTKEGHARPRLTMQQIDRVTDSAITGALAALI